VSLEDCVCSELEKESTIEHDRLSQCDRIQIHTEEVETKQVFINKEHNAVTCIVVTICYSDVLCVR
jgi:hypothetical protein